MKKRKEPSYPILKTGNFYFPVKDIGKKFRVENIIDLEINIKHPEIFRLERKFNIITFKSYADPIWKELSKFLKKNKEYKNCWFVPTSMHLYGEKAEVSIDILRPAR